MNADIEATEEDETGSARQAESTFPTMEFARPASERAPGFSPEDSSRAGRTESLERALVVDEFQFQLTQPVADELAARAPRIFALAQAEAERIIGDLVATNSDLRAILSTGEVEIDEVIAPVRLAVDERSDEALAQEIAAYIVGQVVERGVNSVSSRIDGE